MTEKTIDLKQLLYLISDQKELDINLNLDEGCTFEADDPKPLVKVINYLLNYMAQLTAQTIEISLDLLPEQFRLSFLAYTTAETLPEISGNLQNALDMYQAVFQFHHEKGRYVKASVSFQK